jgi:hypothetical protein
MRMMKTYMRSTMTKTRMIRIDLLFDNEDVNVYINAATDVKNVYLIYL